MKEKFWKTGQEWSNREIEILKKYKERVKEMEVQETAKNILKKDVNNISFYQIMPKEELPKYLQKMVFQTINHK